MAPLAPVPPNRQGHTGTDSRNGYGYGYGAITPTTDPHGPSPLRQGAVARHEAQHQAWVDYQQASSYPVSMPPPVPPPVPPLSSRQGRYAAYDPARYLSPHSGPAGPLAGPLTSASGATYSPFGYSPFGTPAPYTVPLAQDERSQLLVLREFYEIVTGPEKDGERARRLRAIAGAVGLPLADNPLTASQPHLDSDALLHRWLRWVRYCRQEAGDVEPFFRLMHSTLYGDAFWAARTEGERLCARALIALYTRDGSPGQRPDPRRRPFAYSDRTLLQTAATLAGVRWAPASLEYQRETGRTLATAQAQGRMRPPLVALLIAPMMPTGPERAMPPQTMNQAMDQAMDQDTPATALAPLGGPCIVVRTTDERYAAAVNWDFACMLGYLTLLRPFFVGTGHPGDYRELPSPHADTSITPHLHQFALALTSVEACPPEMGCECGRVRWTLNLPPAQHPQATDALQIRAVEDYESARGISRPTPRQPLSVMPRPNGTNGTNGATDPNTGSNTGGDDACEGSRGGEWPSLRSGPPSGPPSGSHSVPHVPHPTPSGLPFAEWPPESPESPDSPDSPGGRVAPLPGESFAGWPEGESARSPAAHPSKPLPLEPLGTGASTMPGDKHTLADMFREQQAREELIAAQEPTAGDAAAPAYPLYPSDEAVVWSGNAADLVDKDLLDTGEAGVAGSAYGSVTAADDATLATGPLDRAADMPNDERRYMTPVLPVQRPHRGSRGGNKSK